MFMFCPLRDFCVGTRIGSKNPLGTNGKRMKPQRIRDPIHSLIEFDCSDDFESMCWKILDSRPFQRLRRIKQLGFSDFVYPCATHSRLSHSIGVFHTARRIAKIIERKQNAAYDSRKGRAAIAAALVHDLGHGPFSHSFEKLTERLGLEKHEATTVQIIKQTEVAQLLNEFSPGFASEVTPIIANKVPSDIYSSIVASQFDADRLDYMRRDRFMSGSQGSAIDFDWLMANLEISRVKIGQDERQLDEVDTLVVGQKAVLAAEAYVLGLFHLYPTIYFHKTTRCAEKLCEEALFRFCVLVRDDRTNLTLLPDNHPLTIYAKNLSSIDAFLGLDDYVIWGSLSMLRSSKDKCLSECSRRLLERRFFKSVDISAKLLGHFARIDNETDRQNAVMHAANSIAEKLQESDLMVEEGDSPRILQDSVRRNPYRQYGGDEAVLDRIYAKDRSGELVELSSLSSVVKGLKEFYAYRVYYDGEDEQAKNLLDDIILEVLK